MNRPGAHDRQNSSESVNSSQKRGGNGELDPLDMSILGQLLEQPSRNFTEIARVLGVHRQTVANRVQRQAFRRALRRHQLDAVRTSEETQVEAVHQLAQLMRHPDPRISIRACKIILQPVLVAARDAALSNLRVGRAQGPTATASRRPKDEQL